VSDVEDIFAAGLPGRDGLRSLADYTVRRVIWLDKPFLQRAAFVLLVGRKGVCKGTYICGLSAQVTRGDLYEEPKRVLVVTSEDSVELDFKPRFLAAGGDERFVEIVVRDFRMPHDLEWLRAVAVGLGDVGLIVIDPIANHIAGTKTNTEEDVREAIKDLNPIADELDCMLFGVRHLGKDASRGALAAVLGSTAWVDLPRSVILMAVDDEDEMLFHAQVVAGNRGPRNYGRVFRLELVDVLPAVEITRLVPAGESTKDVEALLGVTSNGATASTSTSRSDQAREQILDLLDDGSEMESDALDALIVKSTGLAVKTVRNVRSKLNSDGFLKTRPEKDEFGTVLRWWVRRSNAPRDLGSNQPDSATGRDLEKPRSRHFYVPVPEPHEQARSHTPSQALSESDVDVCESPHPVSDTPGDSRDLDDADLVLFSDEEKAEWRARRARATVDDDPPISDEQRLAELAAEFDHLEDDDA
jgi:hypothetical protein